MFINYKASNFHITIINDQTSKLELFLIVSVTGSVFIIMINHFSIILALWWRVYTSWSCS